MESTTSFFEILKAILWEAPGFLVVMAGILFLFLRTMPKRAKTFAYAGLLLLILDGIIGLTFRITGVFGGSYGGAIYQLLQFLSSLTPAAGVACLIAAVCADNKPEAKKAEVNNPYDFV
jgi:heme A synthase